MSPHSKPSLTHPSSCPPKSGVESGPQPEPRPEAESRDTIDCATKSTLDRSALQSRAMGHAPISDAMALSWAELPSHGWPELQEAAAEVRDRAWGRRLTYSPKVFLPVTNLCRNHCDYCSFRHSPGESGAWTMTPSQVESELDTARSLGCIEALLCLGDQPESAFGAYRKQLASWGFESTVAYLHWIAERALERGLLPHTNAGILSVEEMTTLRPVNVSLGLMLESVSERLCQKGGPHHRAPDKRPARRIAMTHEAGRLKIPFTSGILVGIGETPRERVDTLLAIRDLHHAHGHIQEVIVQNFRARPGVRTPQGSEVDEATFSHTIALARLILDDEVSVQAPPNLSPGAIASLVASGINDFGGISALTPDYINPLHPWPLIGPLRSQCHAAGFELVARLPVYDRYIARADFLDPALSSPIARITERGPWDPRTKPLAPVTPS